MSSLVPDSKSLPEIFAVIQYDFLHRLVQVWRDKMFFVYMVRCADGSLYTGFAKDPEERVRVHNAGKGAKYTRSRLPVTLVYVESCESLSAALKRERQLKPWNHARKEALVNGSGFAQ